MPNPNPPQADATQLRCQLDPLSTPQLRGRLDRLFGQPTHPDEVDRHAVLSRLLEAYGALGARTVLQMRGVLPRADAPMAALLAELRATSFPSGAQRERPRVRAEGYMVLARPHDGAAAGEAVHASEADPRGAEPCAEGGEGGEGGGAEGGEGEGEEGGRSVVAFDLMALNLADLDDLPSHMATLAHFRRCERRHARAEAEAAMAEEMRRSERLEAEAAQWVEQQRAAAPAAASEE
jgi:hypothetical protein